MWEKCEYSNVKGLFSTKKKEEKTNISVLSIRVGRLSMSRINKVSAFVATDAAASTV